MQASYSLYFLLEMRVTMSIVIFNSVTEGRLFLRHTYKVINGYANSAWQPRHFMQVAMKLSQSLELAKWSFVLIGGLFYVFFLSWTGQKLINFSGEIFQDTNV